MRRPIAACTLAAALLGCAPGQLSGSSSGGGWTDPGPEWEGGGRDAGTDEWWRDDAGAPGVDAGRAPPPPPPPPPGGLGGVVTYDRPALDSSGLGAISAQPAAAVTVEALSASGTVVATTHTDAEGRYAFAAGEADGAASVRVRARLEGALGRLVVGDLSGAEYVWVLDVVSVDEPLSFHLIHENAGGAMAIVQTLRRGYEVIAAAASVSSPPQVSVRWERGRNTPEGTSYVEASTGQPIAWILGTVADTDEYDEPVLLHELGHALQFTYDWANMGVPGDGHAGAMTDPRNAFVEGWATLYAAAVTGDGHYLDSNQTGIAIDLDLDALPASGEFVANPGGAITQTHSEYVVAGALWGVYRAAGDPAAARRQLFQVLTDWLPRDRGLDGPDLVDALDGHLCLGAGMREPIRAAAVTQRRFPYDFGATCSKPGRPRRALPRDRICGTLAGTRCSLDLAGEVALGVLSAREAIVLDAASGERLHLVRID